MTRIKFDRRKCESCRYFYTMEYGGYAGSNSPYCHYKGKKIDNGECYGYDPADEKPSNMELCMRAQEEYQNMWN